MLGFTFNGKHCFKDFRIVMKSKNRPILPEPKEIVEDVQSIDGEYDFSEVNPEGRTKYKTKPIEVECTCFQKDLTYLRIRAHEIATWLNCGKKPLIFDDETPVYYLAKVSNQLDLEQQIAQLGRFTINFKCDPYAYGVIPSNEQLKFGQGIVCGYGYRLDMVPTIYKITEPTTLKVYNPGTFINPIIKIIGTGSNISITSGLKTLSYNKSISSAELKIDCKKMQATLNGVNVNNDITGNVDIEFTNGNNDIQISGSNLDLTLTLEFKYPYL